MMIIIIITIITIIIIITTHIHTFLYTVFLTIILHP